MASTSSEETGTDKSHAVGKLQVRCDSPQDDAKRRTNKRKAAQDQESPKKKQRGDSDSKNRDSCSMTLEGASVRGRKRKAEAEEDSQRKRMRPTSNTKSSASSSGVVVTVSDSKLKINSDADAPQRTIEGPDTVAISSKPLSSVGDIPPELLGSDVIVLGSTTSSPDEKEIYDGSFSVKTSQAEFRAKYLELSKLGEGGFGSVHEGYRMPDMLPVAIKYVPKHLVTYTQIAQNGKTYKVIHEVYLMVKAAGGSESSGRSAVIALLDCFDLEDHLILVMERPRRSTDLYDYRRDKGGWLTEDEAKVIMRQMMDAAIDMHSKGVFHRDIKPKNILLDLDAPGSEAPQVRVIDFGCGSLEEMEPYDYYSGTQCLAPPEWLLDGQYWARPTTVWHMGALLYDLLDRPHSFNTSMYLQEKIGINSRLSTRCKDFLRQCLAVDPSDRGTLEELQHHPWLKE